MISPVCSKCDCVHGCAANPVPCPILLAECIASGQVSAEQIEAHRVLDAAICTPAQARELAIFVGYDPELTDALCSLADQIEALMEKAIAQPEQKAEPVAWAIFAGNGNMRLWSCKESYVQAHGDELGLPLVPLYTHPAPVRQPLTTEEIGAIHVACGTPRALHIEFASAIEARHGITTLESKK